MNMSKLMQIFANRPSLSLIPLLVFIWLAHFMVDVMLGIWPLYKTMIGLDLASAGIIVACGAMIGEGAQLIFGSLSDRGYRQLLIAFGLTIAGANLFLPYVSSTPLYFLLFLTTCIGSGCFHPCSASLVNSIDPVRRSFYMTIFASGGSCGLAASQLIFSKAHAYFEGNTFPLVLPILVLSLLLLLFKLPSVKTSSKQNHRFSEIFTLFRIPALRNLYLSQIANQSIAWATIFILPDILKTWGHSDWVCLGGGHCFFILGGAVAMVPMGYLADKFSPRIVLLGATILSSCLFYFILMTGAFATTSTLVGLFILGASLTVVNPISVSWGVKLEPQRPGLVSAFLMGLVWVVSESVGPGAVGALSHLFEDAGSVKALSILGLFFIVQIYALLSLPEEQSQYAYEA